MKPARTARRAPGGELIISAIDKQLKDMDRYIKFRDGVSIVQQAIDEHMSPDAIQSSVSRGRSMYDGEQQMRWRDARIQSMIENEKIRSEIRARVGDKLIAAIEKLIEGNQTVPQVNPVTGEVVLRTYVDLTIVEKGVEQARKVLSLESSGSQTTVNIQQNNNSNNMNGGSGYSYEDRITRIREAQESSRAERPEPENVIDVESTEVPDTPADTPSNDTEGGELF